MLALLVLASVSSTSCLQCYSGWQIWDASPPVNNVTLQTCGRESTCCTMVSSLPGTSYGCYSDCPSSRYHSCGPDPKLGIQDLYYCYCPDHRDANCRPYMAGETTTLPTPPPERKVALRDHNTHFQYRPSGQAQIQYNANSNVYRVTQRPRFTFLRP